MVIIVLQVLAWLAWIAATVALGAWLRGNPSKSNAERTSRILHLLFWLGVVPPTGMGFLYPGLTGFDEALGLSPLPGHPLLRVAGALALLIGLLLIVVSNLALNLRGEGAGALLLTRQLVAGSIYGRTRNPMALGLYLAYIGVGLLAGSTYLTLGSLLGVIPAHLFYIKYFEEYELELRMGQPYLEYKQRVPFLLPRLGPRKE
jgi:protein-S-isoprenylcysteine O-methyltransferase Ste14